MGLFVIPVNYDKSSIKEYLEACVANIQLYLDYPDADYLIEGFAKTQIEQAIEKIKEKKNIDKNKQSCLNTSNE